MEDLLAARLQMALSLAFHIVFASIGIAMPFLMASAHYRWLTTGDRVALLLTKAWSRGVAIFFAVGAVSGTVLSFELGLLWPTFMEHAGPLIGMPFSWEGTAFFLEAIALGLFLYGWGRLNRWLHWWCGIIVGLSGVASSVFVIAVNGWMNSPAGFDWIDGAAVNIDPYAAMFNDAFLLQSLHMIIAAFLATGVAVSGLHAWLLLRGSRSAIHRTAIRIAMPFVVVAAILQPISGDLSARDVAHRQPEKFAAMEAIFKTEHGAPLTIGGLPDVETQEVHYAVRIPRLLSFLTFGAWDAEVRGLEDFPREEWPPVVITHLAFQVMVGIGVLLLILATVWSVVRIFYASKLFDTQLLRALALATPLGFIAIEAGWTVTETGRQPWIVYRVMRTSAALTPMEGLVVPFAIFTLVYILLTVVLVWVMRRQILALERHDA